MADDLRGKRIDRVGKGGEGRVEFCGRVMVGGGFGAVGKL